LLDLKAVNILADLMYAWTYWLLSEVRLRHNELLTHGKT
jgi:hypothetical protein